jgi:hypothetical protein
MRLCRSPVQHARWPRSVTMLPPEHTGPYGHEAVEAAHAHEAQRQRTRHAKVAVVEPGTRAGGGTSVYAVARARGSSALSNS